MSSKERIEAALGFASKLRMLGDEMIRAALQRQAINLEGHVMVFVARATTSLESVELLVSKGFNTDALSVMRTICELDIDLSFILKENPAERFELFFGYEDVRNWLFAKAIARLHGSTETSAMSVLRARYEDAQARYPDEYKWTRQSIRERAQITGRQHSYDLAYAEGCAASHSGPQTLRSAYESIETDEHIKITLQIGAETPSPRPVVLACVSYLGLLESAMEFCNLSAFRPRYTELMEQLKLLSI